MEILFFSLQVQVRIKTTETNHIFAGQTVSVRNHIWIIKIKIQNKISPFFVQKKKTSYTSNLPKKSVKISVYDFFCILVSVSTKILEKMLALNPKQRNFTFLN